MKPALALALLSVPALAGPLPHTTPRTISLFNGRDLTDDSEAPVGKWNTMVIDCIDNEITVTVNGDLVNHGANATVSSGQIAIQAEGVEVEFRTLTLTPLK